MKSKDKKGSSTSNKRDSTGLSPDRNPEMGGGRARDGSAERGPTRKAQNPEMGGGRARYGSDERGAPPTGRDATAERPGLLERIDSFFQQPQQPSANLRARRDAETAQSLRERDYRPPSGPSQPEEEPELVPGDPFDFGARERRRRRRESEERSALLRRGLLGV